MQRGEAKNESLTESTCFCVTAGVHLIEAIPKSAAGKILRRQLRDLAAADAKSGKIQIRSKL